MNEYKGIIIEESIEDKNILNKLKIIKTEISSKLKWHMHTVLVSFSDIENLSKIIKPKWYMHFWKNREIVAIFKGKMFEFNYDKKETWKPAVDYGLSMGIPIEQLDFPID